MIYDRFLNLVWLLVFKEEGSFLDSFLLMESV